MKKAIVWTAGLLVAAAAIFWFGGEVVDLRTARKSWPRGLGSMADVPGRHAIAGPNATATELVRLAEAVDVSLAPGAPASSRRRSESRVALGRYVTTELTRKEGSIAVPPMDVALMLAGSESRLNGIRDLLIGGPPPVWETNITREVPSPQHVESFRHELTPLPNLAGHIDLHRMLAARALDRARRGDPSAWDELHAIWRLARGLWNRPEVISNLIALALTRTVNGLARRMPTAVEPPWFEEMKRLDSTRAMMAAQQAEMWEIRQSVAAAEPGSGSNPLSFVRRHIEQLQAGWVAERVRAHAEVVDRSGACGPVAGTIARQMPEFTGTLTRALRFEVEREATLRILQMRRGENPSSESRCSDGRWIVTPRTLRFAGPLDAPRVGYAIPLEYELKPQ